MKKNLIALVLATTFGITACGDNSGTEGNSVNQFEDHIKASLASSTQVNFDLLSVDRAVPTPSYLLMDTTTGLLNLPDDPSQQVVIDALNATDGWGPTQPIQINFGADIDPTSLMGQITLMQVENPTVVSPESLNPRPLTIGYDPSNPGDAHVLALASGSTITLLPIVPFEGGAHYFFAIGGDVKDTDGAAVGMSLTYAHLKSTTQPLPSSALAPAQQITQLTEGVVAAASALNADDIVYSSYFSTASAGTVLAASKLLSAQTITDSVSEIWHGSAVDESISDTQLRTLFNFDFSNPAAATPAGNVLYAGTVNLPHYSETAYPGYATTAWQAGMPSLAKVVDVLSNGADADKAAIAGHLANLGLSTDDITAAAAGDEAAQQMVMAELYGATLNLADGSQLDAERIISQYAPLPKLRSVQSVPVHLVIPANSECAGPASNKVAIFQHGITTQKELLIVPGIPGQSLADRLIGDSCLALFAIDMPLHGERTVEDGEGNEINAEDNTTLYLNLANLTVGRDNIRQSVMDVVNLRYSIGKHFAAFGAALEVGDQDAITAMGPLALLSPTSGVSYLGHSLGAMVGIGATNIANESVGDAAADANYFNIKNALFNAPGAGIPYLLLNSDEFGNLMKGNLLSADPSFAAGCNSAGLGDDLPACYAATESQLIAGAEAGDAQSQATLAQFYDVFSGFAGAAQIVLDTVDPINHAGGIDETVPVLLTQVANDAVIPNMLMFGATVGNTSIAQPYSPFGGTMPLIQAMDLTPNTDGDFGDLTRVALMLSSGEHGSLIDPTNDAAITLLMGTTSAAFINK